MYNTELYEDLLQGQGQYQYSLKKTTKTMVICGALLLNTSVPLVSYPLLGNFAMNKDGSDGYTFNSRYYDNVNTQCR